MTSTGRRVRRASIIGGALLVALGVMPVQAGAPSIAFDVSAWDYLDVHAGVPASRTFALTNIGSSTGSGLSVALTGSTAYSINADTCTGVALSQKKSCSVTVQLSFAPGLQTATLTASSKKPGAVATISLTGQGGVAYLAVSPASFVNNRWHFSFVEGQASQTFTVTNVGDGPADSISTTDLDQGDGFEVVNDGCDGQPLAAGATCTFDLSIDTAICTPGPAHFTDFWVTADPYVRDEILVVFWACQPA